MTSFATSSPNACTLRPQRALAGPVIILIFAAAVLSIGLRANSFEYDSDEGLNLIKAKLVLDGHKLYSQVWSDQPPLFTYLLVGLMKLTGPSVIAARCLVLAFSLLLLCSAYLLVRRLEDPLAAALTVLFIATSAWYARLSFSVMIGLPSVAMTIAALYLLVLWRSSGKWSWLILSAAALALALQIKLSSATAVPAFAALALMRLDDHRPISIPRRLLSLAVWAGCAAAIWLAIAHFSGQTSDLLIRYHLDTAKQEPGKGKLQLLVLFKRDPDLLLLAIGLSLLIVPLVGKGGGYSMRLLLPAMWAAVVAIVIQFHAPVWPHYILLAIVPVAWSAALGTRPLIEHVGKMLAGQPARWGKTDDRTYSIPSVIIVAMVAGFLCYKVYSRAVRLQDGRDTYEQVSQRVEEHRKQTRCLLTDRFMVAFRANLPVPPSLGPAIGKRRDQNASRDEVVLRELTTYRPEQVLLGRKRYGPTVERHLSAHYALTGTFQDEYRHWLRKDLADR
jgi:4-amino-4-deoxy-L-arabinose transferase-like glycosyltransferase